MARIEPLSPPYEPEVETALTAMMPPGVPPIGLFRTFAVNLPMARALPAWGGYELSADLSLSMRERELVIDRVCARCGCEYEWGVHVAFFAERVELSAEQLASLTHGSPSDPCWDEREAAILTAVDELHDTSTLSDAGWEQLHAHLDDAQVLDLLLLAGWYHAISYAANGAQVDLEPGAPRFDDVR